MKLKSLLLLIFTLISISALGELRLGTGLSTTTGGRMIPALYAGLNIGSFGMSFASVGYQNTLSYHSGHQFNLFSIVRPSKILWGDFEGGLGLGFHSYEIGYKDNLQDGGIKKRGFSAGPAIRALWHFTSFSFIGIEAMYGVRNLLFLFLSSQDSVFGVVGVSF